MKLGLLTYLIIIVIQIIQVLTFENFCHLLQNQILLANSSLNKCLLVGKITMKIIKMDFTQKITPIVIPLKC